jgi:hypothetical protein
VSQLLPYLLLVVCPITMGLMMWLMMRGMDHGSMRSDPRVAELESQVAELRLELRRREEHPPSAAEPESAAERRKASEPTLGQLEN